MKRLFPFRWHPRKFIRVSSHFTNMHEKKNSRAQLARSLVTVFATYLCTPYFQRLGAFAISPHPGVHGFPTCRLLCPIRLSVRALAFRWGLPYLLPTRLNIPHEVSRVRHGSLKRNEVGGVLLAAPIRSLRFPSRPTGQVRLTCMAMTIQLPALAPILASLQPFRA